MGGTADHRSIPVGYFTTLYDPGSGQRIRRGGLCKDQGHGPDAAIRGHVFCSFLALVLRKELMDRCQACGEKPEWLDVLLDLDRLQEATVTRGSHSYTLRTEATGTKGSLFNPHCPDL